jgi:hypothetical protein
MLTRRSVSISGKIGKLYWFSENRKFAFAVLA